LSGLAFRCPACGRAHEVSRARAEMAQGAPLCCSSECEEAERRRASAARLRADALRTEIAALLSVLAILGMVLAVR
jgi:hypothetical protein